VCGSKLPTCCVMNLAFQVTPESQEKEKEEKGMKN
jgi:hypothetical protein